MAAELISLEAKCPKCGVVAAIDRVDSGGASYTVKPAGFSLADLCPVVKARTREQEQKAGIDCPHLKQAIDARIELFRKEHS